MTGAPAAPLSGGVDFDNWDFQDPTARPNQQPPQQPFAAQPQQPQQFQPQQQFQQQQVQQPQQQQAQPQQFFQQQQFQQPQQQQAQPQQFFQQQQFQQPQDFAKAGAAALGINEGLANVALNQAMNQMQSSGVMRWFPFLFTSMQGLFNVGHSYVFRKMLVLLCPFIKRQEGSGAPPAFGVDHGSPGGFGQQSQSGKLGADGLKADVEQPDLYIPLMSYVTYVLIYGLQRGILHDFRPEVLPSTASFAMVLMVLEVGTAKMGFYVSGSPVPAIEILANCSYKYVSVAMMVIVRILSGTSPVYWIFFAYFAACAGWSVRRFLKHFEPAGIQQQYDVSPGKLHEYIIISLAAAQLPLCWLLTPSAAPGAAAAAVLAPR